LPSKGHLDGDLVDSGINLRHTGPVLKWTRVRFAAPRESQIQPRANRVLFRQFHYHEVAAPGERGDLACIDSTRTDLPSSEQL
jgi:hypothetical protein